jgi:hypothetical protein
MRVKDCPQTPDCGQAWNHLLKFVSTRLDTTVSSLLTGLRHFRGHHRPQAIERANEKARKQGLEKSVIEPFEFHC